MAANSGNIDVVSSTDITKHPHCNHGPTLLFERYDKTKGASRQFYACSAFRDRKACDFFQWVDTAPVLNVEIHKGKCHSAMRRKYHKFRKLAREDRSVCCTCGLLLFGSESKVHESQGCQIKKNISLKLLKKPSVLFAPLENNKTFAQYLFSSKSVDFVLETLESLKFTHVLCLGCPRLHEKIQGDLKSGKTSLQSLLMDLDERFGQVYPPTKFVKYNMFNNHYFDEGGYERVSEFLAEGMEGSVLVTDPPFGGMVDALSQALRKISDIWVNTVTQPKDKPDRDDYMPMIWFFPYFMENRILSQLPCLRMLDYKVDYENHALYNNHVKQKGSPVRMFTNLPQSSFKLPADEGYWYCKPCERYSSRENHHCPECKTCPSKDGTTYIHCDSCLRCVKASRVHCYTCQMCQPKDHTCGKHLGAGCHICGDLGHKRRDCPKRGESSVSKKKKYGSKKRKSECNGQVTSTKPKLSRKEK